MPDAEDIQQVLYEVVEDSIAIITLNRPDRRNAQGLHMTYALDAAFQRAARDESVKVIILCGAGRDFSAGHDVSMSERNDVSEFDTVSLWGSFNADGWEGFYSREKEIYLEMAERWRNLPKPMIAAIQGNCISGGLMLAWACDLIVASDDARFMDNTLMMGVCGVELFNHPYEMPLRRAKEWLFTADFLSAQQAEQLGMINHVVPASDLAATAKELARKIASKPMFALRLAKEAMNAAQDLAGRKNLMLTSFAMHQLCHTHNMLKNDFIVDTSAFPAPVKARLDSYVAERGGKGIAEFTQMQIPKK